jgi:hypothetical protein
MCGFKKENIKKQKTNFKAAAIVNEIENENDLLEFD